MYKTLWKEVMRRIEYNFLHWGPFVTQYKILPEEINALNKLEEGQEFNKGLAGHLTDEYELSKEKVFEIIEPYLQSYVQGFWDYRKIKLANSTTTNLEAGRYVYDVEIALNDSTVEKVHYGIITVNPQATK